MDSYKKSTDVGNDLLIIKSVAFKQAMDNDFEGLDKKSLDELYDDYAKIEDTVRLIKSNSNGFSPELVSEAYWWGSDIWHNISLRGMPKKERVLRLNMMRLASHGVGQLQDIELILTSKDSNNIKASANALFSWAQGYYTEFLVGNLDKYRRLIEIKSLDLGGDIKENDRKDEEQESQHKAPRPESPVSEQKPEADGENILTEYLSQPASDKHIKILKRVHDRMQRYHSGIVSFVNKSDKVDSDAKAKVTEIYDELSSLVANFLVEYEKEGGKITEGDYKRIADVGKKFMPALYAALVPSYSEITEKTPLEDIYNKLIVKQEDVPQPPSPSSSPESVSEQKLVQPPEEMDTEEEKTGSSDNDIEKISHSVAKRWLRRKLLQLRSKGIEDEIRLNAAKSLNESAKALSRVVSVLKDRDADLSEINTRISIFNKKLIESLEYMKSAARSFYYRHEGGPEETGAKKNIQKTLWKTEYDKVIGDISDYFK